VSEDGWCTGDDSQTDLSHSHRAQFLLASCRAVEAVSSLIPAELAIGCAIAEGEMSQVFILGRYDYLGSPINTASKLQGLAWNEVCVPADFYKKLEVDGFGLPSVPRGHSEFQVRRC